jgi:hypothetical protein
MHEMVCTELTEEVEMKKEIVANSKEAVLLLAHGTQPLGSNGTVNRLKAQGGA